MPEAPFPILFITATRIGDAVLSSGLIRRLAEEVLVNQLRYEQEQFNYSSNIEY
jgi:hypothetical protein